MAKVGCITMMLKYANTTHGLTTRKNIDGLRYKKVTYCNMTEVLATTERLLCRRSNFRAIRLYIHLLY